MKVTYARGLDPKAAHAKIAGIHTPNIASVEDYIFQALTKRLFHLPKKYWAGASVTYVSAGADVISYRYPVNGVKVTASLSATGIRIMSIEREPCHPKSKERVKISLTNGQTEILAKNAVSDALAAA